MSELIKTKAPGRICFFGDHQDYLNLPVIAGTIDRFINIEGKPNGNAHFKIKLIDFDSQIKINLNESMENLQKGDYLRSSIRVLKKSGIIVNNGYDIEIKGDIPIKAGLSSSSALTVAWLRFLTIAAGNNKKYSNEQFAKWAHESEVLEFNEAGGLMDQYTISIGGILYIRTSNATFKKLNASLGTIIIGNSGIEKNTQEILSRLKNNALRAIDFVKKDYPNFKIQDSKKQDYYDLRKNLPFELHPYFYAAIFNYDITKNAILELENPVTDITNIANLINAHQEILDKKLNNTPQGMIFMMKAAKSAGAKATKIVGSGGGGCFLAMTDPQHEEKVINSILGAGAVDAFSVNLI
ncbi:MAG: mevalonate kinase [Flavobacteriaceae bacterium]